MPASDEAGRPAGLLERYHITRQYLQFDSCVLVAGRVSHPTGQQLSEASVFTAVSHAVQTHAALSTRILDERGPNPRFGRIPQVQLDRVVRFLSKEDRRNIAEVMEEEFTNPIDASKDLPLWRVTITPDNHIIFTWHHAIGDGQSGLAALRTLLDGLNQSVQYSSEDTRVVRPNSEIQLISPLESLTDLSVSFKKFLSALGGLIIPLGWKDRSVWTGAKVVSDIPASIENRVRIIHIDENNSTRLVSSARTHNATLTAALYILALTVLTKLVSEQPSNKGLKRFCSTIPISLRPLAKLPQTVMTEAVSTYRRYDPFSREFTWDKAASFTDKLRKEVPKSPEVIGCLKFLFGNYKGYFVGQLGKKRGTSFELSNVGAFKLNEEEEAGDQWRFDDTYFAQDDRYLGAALKLNVAGSPNGSVNICVTWGEGVVGKEFAEAFTKALEEAIGELCNKD